MSSLDILEQKGSFLRRKWLLLDAGPNKEWLAVAAVSWFYCQVARNRTVIVVLDLLGAIEKQSFDK